MANQYDDDDQELDGPELIKDLRRQIKALSKEKSELTTELGTVRSGLREQSVASVLNAKGVNPKVAKFIPSDVEGEEALSKWLDENADVFGFQVTNSGQATEQVQSNEDVDATRRLQALGSNSKPPASATADLEARLAAATTQDELDQIWADGRKYFL